MQQYFTKENVQVHTLVCMDEEQAHHIKHVMRMKPDEVIRIATSDAHLFRARVQYDKTHVYANILEEIEDHTRNSVQITLLQGIIKKEKWDFLLQKCAELGVDTIVPFTSSRSVVKSKEERLDKKMGRWNKILQEGCEQCKRSTLVNLLEPCTFQQALTYKSDLNLIAYEDADVISEKLHRVLQQNPTIKSVTIMIGCEGGLSKEEVAQCLQFGYQRISLGSRILRAETAAMASIHAIAFFYDMWEDRQC